MPYIKEGVRERFDDNIEALCQSIETSGELNYVMTRIAHEVLNNWGHKYANMNEVIGAIECMKLELYRRVLSPYEDEKIAENGDVHPNL